MSLGLSLLILLCFAGMMVIGIVRFFLNRAARSRE
jgi:hypothetical protein